MPGGGGEAGITGFNKMVGSGGNIFHGPIVGGGRGGWRGTGVDRKVGI